MNRIITHYILIVILFLGSTSPTFGKYNFGKDNVCIEFPTLNELKDQYILDFPSSEKKIYPFYLPFKQYAKLTKELTNILNTQSISCFINMIDTFLGIQLTGEKIDNFNNQIKNNPYHNTTSLQLVHLQEKAQALLLEKAKTNKDNEEVFQFVYQLKAILIISEFLKKSSFYSLKYIYLSLYAYLYGYKTNPFNRSDKFFHLYSVNNYINSLDFEDPDQKKLIETVQEHLQLANSLSSPIYGSMYLGACTLAMYKLYIGNPQYDYPFAFIGAMVGVYPFLPSFNYFETSDKSLLKTDKRFRTFCLLKHLQYEWSNNILTTYNLFIQAGISPSIVMTIASMTGEDPVILTDILGQLLPF